MPVLSEIATMTEVAQGTSLARFGDGELLIMAGKDAKHQKFDDNLALELREVLDESPCLIGVPHTRGIRSRYWAEFLQKHDQDITPNRWYGSAFVSRDDEVSWDGVYRGLLKSLFIYEVPLVVAAPDYPYSGFGDWIPCNSERSM